MNRVSKSTLLYWEGYYFYPNYFIKYLHKVAFVPPPIQSFTRSLLQNFSFWGLYLKKKNLTSKSLSDGFSDQKVTACLTLGICVFVIIKKTKILENKWIRKEEDMSFQEASN